MNCRVWKVIRSISLICLILLFTWSFRVSAQSQKRKHEKVTKASPRYVIPFTYDPLLHPLPTIYLRINHSPPLPFLLDTGTSSLLIKQWAAKQLNLIPNKNHSIKYDINTIFNGLPTRAETTLKVVTLVKGHAGCYEDIPLPSQQKSAYIVDTPNDGYAGTLGISFFRTAIIQLDFSKKTLSFFSGEHPPLNIPGAMMLPLQRELNIYSVRLPLLHSSPLPLFVDTGSPYILLPPEIVTELHPEKTPPVFDVANLAGETFEVQAFLLPQFKIGNIQEPQVVVYATKGLPVPAILGMNFLSRFRVTLDLRHCQMWLERASDYHKRLTLPGLPCILATEQEGLIVDVLSGCAAEKAGIQKGDKILRVDGQEVKTLSFSSLSTLLNGLAGTQAEIIVERARVQKPPIRFIRQSLFAMPNGRGSGVGINAGMSPTGKLLITAIERHSPAEEAELQTGDEIVAVNGFKVGTASLERIIAETKQPEGTKIILIIQHPGEDKPREIKLKVRKLL